MKNTCSLEKIFLDAGDTCIARIVLNRPFDNGRLTVRDCEVICKYLKELQLDETCTAVILTGTGESFCMGACIKEGQSIATFMESFQKLHQQFSAFHKPVYAAVNGRTGGGGMTLAAATDQVFAVPETQFLLPEISSGAIPDFALRELSKQLPKKVLFEMASTGKAKTAKELEAYGFVKTVEDVEAAAFNAAKAVSFYSKDAVQKICSILKQQP